MWWWESLNYNYHNKLDKWHHFIFGCKLWRQGFVFCMSHHTCLYRVSTLTHLFIQIKEINKIDSSLTFPSRSCERPWVYTMICWQILTVFNIAYFVTAFSNFNMMTIFALVQKVKSIECFLSYHLSNLGILHLVPRTSGNRTTIWLYKQLNQISISFF